MPDVFMIAVQHIDGLPDLRYVVRAERLFGYDLIS